jgi:hypothetical protein
MKATYFWYQDTLVTLERDRQILVEDFRDVAMHKYRYCPCVDTFEPVGVVPRYGAWEQNDKIPTWPTHWVSRPMWTFPAEFRAHLLLLGVS